MKLAAALLALLLAAPCAAQVYVPHFAPNGQFSYRQVTPTPYYMGGQGYAGYYGGYGAGYRNSYGYGARWASPYPYSDYGVERELRLLRWSVEDAALTRGRRR